MTVRIKMDLGGIEDFRAKMMRLDQATRVRVWQKMNDIAMHIKVEAQRLCPVRTGFLRSTIYAKMTPPNPFGMTENRWILKVGAWASYAVYQELGTRYIEPRRFLQRAVEMYMRQLAEAMHEALEHAISEAAG